MLQSFHHYFGVTVKIRKNRIFHWFFYFWPWCLNNNVMNPTPWWFPVNFSPKNCTSKLNFEKKKIADSRKGSRVRSQNRENDHFRMSDGIFVFCGKKSWSYCFLAWNLPEITIMLQLFQHYSGITDESWKNRFFRRFSYFWPWSRNNYVMIPTTW